MRSIIEVDTVERRKATKSFSDISALLEIQKMKAGRRRRDVQVDLSQGKVLGTPSLPSTTTNSQRATEMNTLPPCTAFPTTNPAERRALNVKEKRIGNDLENLDAQYSQGHDVPGLELRISAEKGSGECTTDLQQIASRAKTKGQLIF